MADRRRQSALKAPAHPDPMTSVFGEVLAVEGAKKIAQAREAHDELVAKVRLQEVAGEHNRWLGPGVQLGPVFHHVRSIVLEATDRGLSTGFVNGQLERPWHASVPQGHPRKRALLPGDFGPIHESQRSAEFRVSVVLTKERFEDITRTFQPKRARGRGVRLRVGDINPLNGVPAQAHRQSPVREK